jgi:hypothetical protein
MGEKQNQPFQQWLAFRQSGERSSVGRTPFVDFWLEEIENEE